MDLVKRCFGGGSKQQQRRPNRERLRRCFGGTNQKKKQKRSQRRFRASKLLSSSDEEETVHESMLQPSEEKETVHESMFLQPSINLGEDICTEIFRLLPVKSTLKFRSLSKGWLSVLSSQGFRQNHASTHHNKRALVGLFFPIDDHIIYGRINIDPPNLVYTLPFFKRPDAYLTSSSTCISSCNGLQLFRIPKWNSTDHMYHIYNPTTEESKALLDIPPHISKNKFVCASLAFDPCEPLYYKIIFLCQEYEFSNRYQIEVYSSATGICKAPESNTLIGDFACNLIRGIFCNGAIHWLSEDATLIAYFNVHTDCIKEVPTPRFARKIHYFGESQGHLHLVNSDHQYFYKSSVLDVYELKGDYSGWFLKYQVDLASIASVLPQQVYPSEDYGTFMSIFRHEEDDDSNMVLLVRGNNWVEYNFKRKTTKRLCEHVPRELLTSPFPWTYGFNTHQFIPTLTCL